MTSNYEYTACALKIYEALTSGKGLQHIVDTAAKIFDNPLLVADTAFKVLAHAEKPDIRNELWQSIIRSGIYPSEYVYSIRGDNDLYNQVFSSSVPEIVSDGVSPHRFLSKMVTVDDKPVGFATCVENDSALTGRDAQLFDVFCRVVGTELRRNELFAQNRNRRYAYFISEMISEPVRADFLEERIRQIGIKIKSCNFIMAFEFADEKMRREHQIEYFCKEFEQLIPDGHCIAYRNSIVSLISRDGGKLLNDAFTAPIIKQLVSTDMIGAISHRFRNIADMSIHYRQAKEAVRIARRLKSSERLFDYARMSFLHMAGIVGGTEELRAFCSPELLDVIEYDSSYGTTYAKTIHAYLYYDRNPSLLAKHLDIHRNTVDYRIKKLEELFGFDFNKQETIFSLDMSLRILEYLHELPT